MEARTLALIAQRQQEQNKRRTSATPSSRFLNVTREGKKRRGNRLFMQKARKAAKKKYVAPQRKIVANIGTRQWSAAVGAKKIVVASRAAQD